MIEKETTVTRAEKKDGAKKLILEILRLGSKKSNEIIDEASKVYAEKFGGEDTENPNDVKGRIGSVLDVMKKEGEVSFEGGTYSLKVEQPQEEKPKKTTRARTKKETKAEETVAEKPKKTRKTTKTKKVEETPAEKTEEEIIQPLPPAPVLPIAPVAPITPEVAPEPIPEDKPKKTVKSRAKKEKLTPPTILRESEETIVPIQEKTDEKKKEEKAEVKTAQEVSSKAPLMDMSFLFNVKPETKKILPLPAPKTETVEKKAEQNPTAKAERKAENKPKQKKTERVSVKNSARELTADEKLQEAFLSRLRKLGGLYFEYYSVYLLERYSRMNGRRLESLKITGGDHDGGIDGEIELTDRLGFRETIYIQAKNWDPEKGNKNDEKWVVGETLLQQFIGACVCRQAKDKKQRCRGIFITTSRFTPEARKILEDTSDKYVGYDGADLFETAKESRFGILNKNGVWVLDEDLLSSEKAFFHMF